MENAPWQKVKEIVGTALELPSAERRPFLDHACAPDKELRAEIESLLAAHRESDGLSECVRTASALGPEVALEVIAPYRLWKELGTGGMGQVWLAEQAEPVRRPATLRYRARSTFGGTEWELR